MNPKLDLIFIKYLQYSEEDRNKTDEEKNQDGLVRGIGTDGMKKFCKKFSLKI